MSQEAPQECVDPGTEEARAPPERTSDCYRVSAHLPARFNNPACFRGYRSKEPASIYRTSNQTYGGQAPTVHEMPKVFYPTWNKFSRHLAAFGMFRNSTFNVCMEKSFVTGPGNYITPYDRLNFHPSYNASKPSFCE
ncbi:PREDICTED: UPF0691 protein C9orf116 homolog [Elephantulus edwardii]|uniref:UPF0691 protein C9orf116 homolog n=1 Tax=Elephantulus edwardii TaxID=28737 RepID=UPI0003F075EB|nr:PREDICTED: UPF0691 protein C9orf116 homolog [Elephantulus edwardii]